MEIFEITNRDDKNLIYSFWERKDIKFLINFLINPFCHFYMISENDNIKGVLVGELKCGKFEIYRFYAQTRNHRQYFKSGIEYLIKNPEIYSIVVFQNLSRYFNVLKRLNFKYDADIEMELKLNHWEPDESIIEIDFEKLRKKHWHIVYELKKLCYINDFYQRLIAPEYLDKYIKEMTNQLFEKNICGIVGKINNEIVGIACWIEDKIPEIIDIMVFPKKQGKGYDKAILNEVIYFLKSKGYKRVCLGVFGSNKSAKNLYKKIGFKKLNQFRTVFWKRN